MGASDQSDKYGFIAAARGRRRHLPIRFVGTALVALGLYVIFGWWQAWIWLAVYYGVQLSEVALNPVLLKKPPQTPVVAVLTAISLYIPSSLAFGALAPVLWFNGGHYGPAMAIVVLGASLINLVAVSSGSRMAFIVSTAPYIAALALIPLLDVGRVPPLVLSGMLFASAMMIFNTLAAWKTTEEVHTAQRDARLEADRRRHEAEEAIEAKSAFVAMICHELRTPISAITAGANELQRTASNGGRAQAELIGHAGQMMRTLLDDMLDFSRLEAGKMSVEHTPFDLRKAVADVTRMWKPQAQAKGLRLRMDGAARLPQWVSGDPTRMRQVLNNLLSNAIKFTDKGAITLHLDAGAEEGGRRPVTLSVEDTGPGMTPDQIERLFTPFDQLGAGTARKHGGSGLGLAISRELARLMGGDLTVASVAGEGAAFTLNLSLEEVATPAAEQAPAAVEARVLVVDDHAVNRQAIALVLAPLGITPELAASAEEGLERLAHEPFDVVLMDVYMPDMDGREATRKLRAQAGPNRDVPVIAITASATPADWEDCRAAGMNGHVGKPIEPAALYAALEAVVNGETPAAVVAA